MEDEVFKGNLPGSGEVSSRMDEEKSTVFRRPHFFQELDDVILYLRRNCVTAVHGQLYHGFLNNMYFNCLYNKELTLLKSDIFKHNRVG